MGRKSPAARLRARERKLAAYEAAMAPLRAAGASCSTCDNYEKAPASIGFSHHCAADEDHGAYVKAEANGLCPRWRERAAPASISGGRG